RPQVGHILRAGQHPLTLSNELLDIARIEAWHFPLTVEPIALASALHEALSLVSPMATDTRIQPAALPALSEHSGVIA
ncbi:histidine kinase, partial [Pseudomonas chlororaphis]